MNDGTHVTAMVDQSDVADAYLRCLDRVSELGSTAPVSTPIPACPGWTLHDVCAHLAGNATALADGDLAPSSPQAWIDEQLDRRRNVEMLLLLTELADSGARFACRIAAEPRRWVGIVYDAIAHEHDLRGALHRPGARDDMGIELSVAFELRLLAHDARERKLPPMAITSGTSVWQTRDGAPAAALCLDDRWELFRVLGSRRSARQIRALDWSGDAELFLSALHMPPPVADITET